MKQFAIQLHEFVSNLLKIKKQTKKLRTVFTIWEMSWSWPEVINSSSMIILRNWCYNQCDPWGDLYRASAYYMYNSDFDKKFRLLKLLFIFILSKLFCLLCYNFSLKRQNGRIPCLLKERNHWKTFDICENASNQWEMEC